MSIQWSNIFGITFQYGVASHAQLPASTVFWLHVAGQYVFATKYVLAHGIGALFAAFRFHSIHSAYASPHSSHVLLVVSNV